MMIGIICAMKIEAEGILALCETVGSEVINGMEFFKARRGEKDVVIVVCGVGKVNAALCAATLINRYNPELVINSGVAGAVSPIVSVGDIVVGTKTVEHDMNTTALGDKQGEVSFPDGKRMYFECDKKAAVRLYEICRSLPETRAAQGIVASGDIFISERSMRMRINDRFSALCCEMEGAAIGHVCSCCGTPFVILRAISDDLEENKGMDFVKFCALASEKTVEVMKQFL